MNKGVTSVCLRYCCLLSARAASSGSEGKPLRLAVKQDLRLPTGGRDTLNLVLALGLTEHPYIMGPPEICVHRHQERHMQTRHEGQQGAHSHSGTCSAHKPAPLTQQTSLTNTSSKIKIARISRWRPQGFKAGVGPGQRGACGNTQVAPMKPGSGTGKQSKEQRGSHNCLCSQGC